MRYAVILVLTLVLAGCAGSSGQYYDAVRKSAEAQERAYAARYKALADIASKSGSTEATAAATMAIALSQPQSIQPRYIESSALKWAQVLVPSATAIGGMYIQADAAKTQAKISRDIQTASIQADQAVALGQQDMILGLGGQYTDAMQQSAGAMDTALGVIDNVAVTGSDNMAGVAAAGIEGLVTANEQGLLSTTSVATAGLETTGAVSLAGMDGIVTTAAQGLSTADSLGQFGLTTAGTLGTEGFATIEDVSDSGIDALSTGLAGSQAITTEINGQGLGTFEQVVADFRSIIDSFPEPLIVEPPEPVIVTPPDPFIVDAPEPIIIEPPEGP